MGKCVICEKSMGLFKGGCCSKECKRKQEKTIIKYGDRVVIKEGFFKGQKGVIHGEYRCIGEDENKTCTLSYGWPVKFDNGDIKSINQHHLKKEEQRISCYPYINPSLYLGAERAENLKEKGILKYI